MNHNQPLVPKRGSDRGRRRIPPAFRKALAPWIEAADGDEDRALDLLHVALRQRLAES